MERVTPFDRVVCVTLDRRADKWAEFKKRCPWKCEKFVAVDGKLCRPPAWWKQGAPAWGCYKSHVRIVEECLNSGVESVMVFEDDAVFCENFEERFAAFWSALPADWDMAYLGGQLITADDSPPTRVNDLVYVPDNVNRTHAYAMSGKFLPHVYKWLHASNDWRDRHHIDHHYGRLHQKKKHNVYIPAEWLVGQAEGYSDIKSKEFEERYWPSAEQVAPAKRKFTLVVGLHASGSSCLATCLHKAGVHMGNAFAYRPDSGEAISVAKMMEEHMPFPSVELRDEDGLRKKMLRWMTMKAKEHKHAGMKYPHLCATARLVSDAFDLRVVHIDRPLEDSVESLKRREPSRTPAAIERVQRFLHDEKTKFLSTVDHVTVDYYSLLERPGDELARALKHVGLKASNASMAQAVAHVDASRRHV